jgi:hypothetical protein
MSARDKHADEADVGRAGWPTASPLTQNSRRHMLGMRRSGTCGRERLPCTSTFAATPAPCAICRMWEMRRRSGRKRLCGTQRRRRCTPPCMHLLGRETGRCAPLSHLVVFETWWSGHCVPEPAAQQVQMLMSWTIDDLCRLSIALWASLRCFTVLLSNRHCLTVQP